MSNASAFDLDALDSRIRELIAFARTRSSEDRSALFRNLVDLFLTGKAPKVEPTRSQLLDVIEALIPHVDSESRRTVADLLGGMMEPPMDLALRLCHDRASLVSNLLTNAPFDEDQIIELIGETGREHHQLIATRDDLTANVWITLARAAPSAPPFDHRSTLALWSDDLGITRTKGAQAAARVQNETAFEDEMEAAPLMAVGADAPVMESEITRKASARGIRIIKTGDDLIAERRDNVSSIGPTGFGSDNKETSKPEIETPEIETPELKQFMTDSEGRSPARDPGPGGWAWQTDRDGLVISISPYGKRLLQNTDELIGASVLDMLGLNTKIGHPVARAFQRRSTIHDAPITLNMLDRPHQHWTLEATPQFSSCGGIFEGYEGIFTPVAPAKDDTLKMPSEADASAMFLDDLTPEGGDTLKPGSATQANDAKKAADVLPETQGALGDNSALISKAATSAIQDLISETLGGLTESATVPQKPAERATGYVTVETAETTPTTQTEPVENKGQPVSDPEISATMDLLEEALKRLMEAAQAGAPSSSVRLQGEIATACVRSLKEQLASK